MPCENCNVQFTVFKRKKSCTECRRLYCSNCLIKRKENCVICQRCVIFKRRPVSKLELLKLKPKDLIFFLQSKHISTTGCVEKEELVNLVIAHVNSSDSNLNSPIYSSSNSSTYSFSHNPSNNCTNSSQQDPFDTIKLTCQNIFSSFTEKINELNNTATNNRNSIGRRTSGPPSAGTSSSGVSHLEAHVPNKTNNSNSPISIKSEDVNQIDRLNTVDDNQRPGPSGQNSSGTSNRLGFNPNDLSSSSTSSFEDLGAALSIETAGNDDGSGRDRGGSFAGGNTSNSSDITDTWQFIQKSSRIINSTINLPTTSNGDDKSDILLTLGNKNKVFRRHSDSEVNLNIRGINNFLSQNRKLLKKDCCIECSQTRSELKKIIRNYRKQMNGNMNSLSDHDKAIRMNEFIRSIENHCLFNNKHNLDIVELPNPADCPILTGSQNNQVAIPISPSSPLNNNVNDNDDEGIYIYPTIHFMYDEHSNNKNFQTVKPSYRMKLTDITSKSELKDLSVKQLKEILMLNRVDFKGCCEKTELLERVYRLWREHKSTPAVEKLSTDDLCKICMDAPIECVILECGHMVTCTNCGKVLNECPICRQYIVRVVRFFRA